MTDVIFLILSLLLVLMLGKVGIYVGTMGGLVGSLLAITAQVDNTLTIGTTTVSMYPFIWIPIILTIVQGVLTLTIRFK